MGVTRRLAVAQDRRFQDHRGPQGHPERPERLQAVARAIAERADSLGTVEARAAGDEEILRVHTPEHLARVREAVRHAPAHLDPDTFVSSESLEVARLAVGTTVEVAMRVARGEWDAGFVAARPPGHHAEASRAMGFCLFNQVAIAARALQQETRVDRILIFDWDVHHGNGTQHTFERDPSVLYFSTHQFPFYPGTGDFTEAGVDAGVGTTINVPLPAGCGDAEYLGVVNRVLVPVAHAFRPDFILVSCGFDAHADDPLASMQVSDAGFTAMARSVRRLAEELCGGRLVLVLEGGYALSGLYGGTRAVLESLLAPTSEPVDSPESLRGSRLHRVVERVRSVHQEHWPGIG